MGIASKIKGKVKEYSRLWFAKQVTNFGINLHLRHPTMNRRVVRSLCRNDYEDEECRILEKTLVPEDRVLEMGAGIGFLSAFAAKRCGNDNVVAIEANPGLIGLIRDNYTLNGVRPTLIHGLAGLNNNDMQTFYLCNDMWGSSTKEKENGKPIEVLTIDVSRLISEFKPTYLIMDIEGAEEDIIEDLDLSFVDKLLIELHPSKIGDGPVSRIIGLLIEEGFSIDLEKCDGISLYFYKEPLKEESLSAVSA